MFGNLGKIMKIAGEMKAKMPEVQEKLESSTFQAEAGDGTVEATVNGRMALVDLSIDPQALNDPDMSAPMLEDLIKAAVSSAQQQAAEAARQAMAELTGGMELPGMDPML